MTITRPVQGSDLVSRVETVVATDMDGEIIMMSVETGKYFHLDGISTSVWQCLEKPRMFDEIVEHLLGEYDVSEEDCRRDTINLVTELCKHNVLKIA